MNKYIKEQVKAHAMREFPNECCGLICVNNVGVVTVVPCENKAFNKRDRFVIDPHAQEEAEQNYGYIVAFYHSHMDEVEKPDRNHLSREDLDISFEAGLPALLYVYPQDTWHYSMPSTYKPADLIGRPFVWGIWDCYASVRDWYLMKRGVKLNDYFAPQESDLSADFGYEGHIVADPNFEDVAVEDLKEGDVIIFKIKSKFCNHSAVYLGGNQFFHQPINKMSSIATLDERYLKYIAKTLRYKV